MVCSGSPRSLNGALGYWRPGNELGVATTLAASAKVCSGSRLSAVYLILEGPIEGMEKSESSPSEIVMTNPSSWVIMLVLSLLWLRVILRKGG
ncbi:hypothetical protein L6452_22487 [Arctium lappa]|uniref:Uncharacterized protein n=1 Tax=Arctium lappa TaxID=4217 RepID=A0ACB9B1N4_ARCLA|nr:hypothetical protein L6452_22487 [Arctium lappa]